MARRYHSSIIEEYLFLKRKVAKCVAKSRKNEKAIIVNRAILTKARKFVKRMLEIEKECKAAGWPHPEVFEVGYVEKNINDFKLPVDAKLLTKPDGTLPRSKIEPLPIVSPSPLLGQMGNSDLKTKFDVPTTNYDGTLFETPKLEGSFLKRRGEEE